jgi:MFS transporter, DHA2 family, methylenomycin A resistance protein
MGLPAAVDPWWGGCVAANDRDGAPLQAPRSFGRQCCDHLCPAEPLAGRQRRDRHSAVTLAAAVLGFFVVTLDPVVVNVALPSIRADLGGGMAGLQWVVDGYTLLFAALLLSAGALSDRVGARRAFGVGITLFAVASAACGLAPAIGALVAARFVQGGAAAVIMPSSMALIGQAYPDPVRRGRAVAV